MRTHHKYMSKVHINFSLHQKLCFDDGFKKYLFSMCQEKLEGHSECLWNENSLGHTYYKWKSPPLTECSGKDELNQLYPTPNIAVDTQRVVSPPYCQCPSQRITGYDLVHFFFYLQREKKTRRWKNCTHLILCHSVMEGDSGQFVSCLISEESHLQCWTYNTSNCKAVMNSVSAKSYLVFLEHEKCNAILIWLIWLYI